MYWRSCLLVAGFFVGICVGCTDAEWGSFTSLGNSCKVELYSGGVKVREWRSSGKVVAENDGDGHSFMDEETGDFVRVNGDVIITCE